MITNKGNVKQETRIEIQKLLSEYGYKASLLEGRKSAYRDRSVMILIGDMYNQFYIEQLGCLSDTLRKHGYVPVIIYTGGESSVEEEGVGMALNEGYAGALFLNVRGGTEIAGAMRDSRIPVVLLNRVIEDVPFDSVCSDNYRGGYMAAKYLIERGHRRIGHLAGNAYSNTTRERVRGYKDAMKKSNLVVSEHSIYYGNLDRQSGYTFGEMIIKENRNYTSVFCGNDLMADGLIKVFQDYGVRVPEEISVICYDDTIISRSLNLTRVSSNPRKMGECAAELLLKRIGDKDAETQSVLFSPLILPGESVVYRKE